MQSLGCGAMVQKTIFPLINSTGPSHNLNGCCYNKYSIFEETGIKTKNVYTHFELVNVNVMYNIGP